MSPFSNFPSSPNDRSASSAGAQAQVDNSLVNDLPYLEELERLRLEADLLLRGGVRALVERDETNVWDELDTPTTTLYLRRAKHLAWRLGLLEQDEGVRFPSLPQSRARIRRAGSATLTLDDGVVLFSEDPDDIPSFHAAIYLRGRLDEPEKFIPADLFLCFYKLLREIHYVDSPDWALGGIRAGGVATEASIFLTSECARALGYLASKLERTATFLREVEQHEKYSREILSSQTHPQWPLPKEWCSAELARVSVGLSSIVERDHDAILLQVSVDGNEDPITRVSELRKDLQQFVRQTGRALRGAIKAVDAFREHEDENVKLELARDQARKRELQRPFVLSQTAHTHARRSLGTLEELISSLQSDLSGGAEFSINHLADTFDAAAAGVRRNMEPIAAFMKSRMYSSLFHSSEEGGPVEIHDLAFASVSAGAMSGEWASPTYARVLQNLSRAMSGYGRFPKGQSFHTSRKGLERYAANAHCIRAYAYIAQRVPGQLALAPVEQILTFFRSTAIPIPLQKRGSGFGWSTSETSKGGKASPWLSAVSCLALHRVEEMLRSKINEQAFRHFAVKTPASLARIPSINELICTDLGLAAVPWKGRQRSMVTADLEAIRAHLHSTSAGTLSAGERRRLSSLILYGPPGTGKTTLIEALAKTARVNLVQVTPSDFLFLGAEGLERQARAVMRSLCLLSGVVILFDEFDTILFSRENAQVGPASTFEFLTGCMLPKLADLNRASKARRSAFALATNYVERLDPAAIRPGRFDHKVCVLPPDAPSRICRLIAQLNREERVSTSPSDQRSTRSADNLLRRLMSIVANTARVPVSTLCKRGWYTRPNGEARPGDAWHYLRRGSEEPVWPIPQALSLRSEQADTNEYVATLVVETGVCCEFERILHDADLSSSNFDWKVLVQRLLTSNSIAEATDDYARRLEQLRAKRLAMGDPRHISGDSSIKLPDSQRIEGSTSRI